MSRRTAVTLPWLLLALCTSPRALASTVACEAMPRLLKAIVPRPEPFFEARLPYSSDRPQPLSDATLTLSVQPVPEKPGRWQAHIVLSFPDPKLFGLPFTFQKLRLGTAEIDWADDCNGVGKALFPGQEWSTDLLLPEELANSWDEVALELWGSRD